MRRAGLVVAAAHAAVRGAVRDGVTTAELDAVATDAIRTRGAEPNFPLVPGYRHTLCTSVNDEVVHGIPGERVLRNGDLLSVDCGAVLDGWHGDAAFTVVVGGNEHAREESHLHLVEATRQSLWAGIAAFRPGNKIGDVGAAVEAQVQQYARQHKLTFGIIEDYEGHGIGTQMHMAPGVPNVATRHRGPTVPSGATVAIEPMVTLGTIETHVYDDDWTVATDDGSYAAHWEHSVAVTRDGWWILTAEDGGEAELARWDLPFAPLS